VAALRSVLRRDRVDHEMLVSQTEMIEENTQYMSDTIEDFSNFFHPDKTETEFIVQDTIDKALNLLEQRTKNIKINIVTDKEVKVFSFEKEFLHVLLIILNNAIDNFESKAIDDPKIDIIIQEKENILKLTVCDNGEGIEGKKIDQIFDPYFSTKFSHEGTGLGLYMAKMMIENSMHGQLHVENKNAGACFEMIIPSRKEYV
jgi:signal transduction histidine kinase